MSKRIFEDRPLTNAEKQKRWRERRKAEGRKPVYAPQFYAQEEPSAALPSVSFNQFKAALQNAMKGFDESDGECVYAELLAYAVKAAVPKYRKMKERAETAFQEEQERQVMRSHPVLGFDAPKKQGAERAAER